MGLQEGRNPIIRESAAVDQLVAHGQQPVQGILPGCPEFIHKPLDVSRELRQQTVFATLDVREGLDGLGQEDPPISQGGTLKTPNQGFEQPLREIILRPGAPLPELGQQEYREKPGGDLQGAADAVQGQVVVLFVDIFGQHQGQGGGEPGDEGQ